jgi:FMN phosphatase YigB (HAD superfamily)
MTNLLAKRISSIAPLAKILTFDVFDTLIMRPVDPHLTIEATTRFVCRRLGLNTHGDDYANVLELRQSTWAVLFEDMAGQGRANEDATIHEMFPLWVKRLAAAGYEVKKNQLTAREIADFEIDLELEVIEPVVDSLSSLRELKDRGIKLYFISDMYLSYSDVARFLDHAGYNGLFDGGFVSGDEGCLKRTGTLFAHVKAAGIHSDLHVGDNKLADHDMPRAAGIPALHWEAPEMLIHRKRANRLTQAVNKNLALAPYALNDLALRLLEREGIPAGLFAQIYANFGLACLNEILKDPGPVILPAREGLVFYAAFEEIAKHSYMPKFTYAPMSRNAVTPVFQEAAPLHFVQLVVRNNPRSSVLSVLRRVGYTDAQVRSAAPRHGFVDIVSPVDFNRDEYAFIRLFADPEFQGLWNKAVEERKSDVQRILDFTTEKDGHNYFIDLGWNGSIQANLEPVLANGQTLEGLYFGLSMQTQHLNYRDSSYRPLIATQSRDAFAHAAFTAPQALELPMLAPHPSVRKVPTNLQNDDWARPTETGAGAGFKAAVQSHTIALMSKLHRIAWLFDIRDEHLAAFTRTLTAVQLWFPDKDTVTAMETLSTDAGLGESGSYSLISHLSGFRSGYRGSLWPQGWAAVHAPKWLQIILLSRSMVKWGFSFYPDPKFDESSESTDEKRPVQLPPRRGTRHEGTKRTMVTPYEHWLKGATQEPRGALGVGSLMKLKLVLRMTNFGRRMKRRQLLEDWSIPLRALIGIRTSIPSMLR